MHKMETRYCDGGRKNIKIYILSISVEPIRYGTRKITTVIFCLSCVSNGHNTSKFICNCRLNSKLEMCVNWLLQLLPIGMLVNFYPFINISPFSFFSLLLAIVKKCLLAFHYLSDQRTSHILCFFQD